MTDRTTEGYVATRDNVEGMLRNLCAYALSEPEPLQRYVELTHQQVLFDGLVDAIRRERGRALADLAEAGTPVPEIATRAKLAAQHVRGLVSDAGRTLPKPRTKSSSKAARRATIDTTVRAAKSTSPVSNAAPVSPTAPVSPAVPPMPAAPAKPTVPSPATRGRSWLPESISVTRGEERTLTHDERLALGLPIPTSAAKPTAGR